MASGSIYNADILPAEMLDFKDPFTEVGLTGVNRALFQFWSSIGVRSRLGRTAVSTAGVAFLLWLLKPGLMFRPDGSMRPAVGLSIDPDATFFYFPLMSLLLGYLIGTFP